MVQDPDAQNIRAHIEIYAYSNVDSGTVTFFSDSSGNERSYFSGFKIIE